MAVERLGGNTIKMTAAADAVTGQFKIQSILLDHSAAATCSITDTAGHVIAAFRTTASKLSEQIVFPKGIIVEGIIAAGLSAGTLYIHLA